MSEQESCRRIVGTVCENLHRLCLFGDGRPNRTSLVLNVLLWPLPGQLSQPPMDIERVAKHFVQPLAPEPIGVGASLTASVR